MSEICNPEWIDWNVGPRKRFENLEELLKELKTVRNLFWTKEDISAYTQEYGLPESEAYQKYGLERTGCKWCTGHLDWERQVSRLNERVFFKIMHDMGQTTLDNF